MMKKSLILFSFCLLAFHAYLHSQMKIGDQIFYGNEWIDYSKEYFKIKIAEDGLYRIDKSVLESAGFWKPEMDVNKIAIFYFGKQIPLYVSNKNFTNSDYILFYGEKNKVGLDSFLYQNKYHILNPNLSLFSDTNTYYITYLPNSTGLRYKNINPNYNNITLPLTEYYYHTQNVDFLNRHYKPFIPGSDKFQHSYFIDSEGYVKSFGNSTSDSVKFFNLYNSNSTEPIRFNVHLSNNQIALNIKEFYFNDVQVASDTSFAYASNKTKFSVPVASITSSNLLRITGKFDIHNFGLAHYNYTYPRSFIFDKLNFSKWKLNATAYFKIENYKDQIVLLDILNQEAISLKQGSNTECLISSAKNRELVFDNKITPITNLTIFKPIDIKNFNAQYLIISSKKLKRTSTVDELENYRKYRESAAGGSYKSTIIFAEDIYDHFGYGIPNHQMAFKNLSHYLQKNWPALEFIFIIGKAREYYNARTKEQLSSVQTESFYVPTFGSPPSDDLLFTTDNKLNVKYAVGRLAAQNMEDVKNYLNKIKVHETAINGENNEWVKNIMHLGGGGNLGEKNTIRESLRNMENIIALPKFGGRVSTFFKDNSSTVQIANLPLIKEKINKGLGIINFFGHAAVGTFDFTLDDPNNYDNEGRLPFVFSLGCYSGNICTNSKGVSEEFVLSKSKGATGFIAATGTAFINTQGRFGADFYSKLTNEFYNEPVGKLIRKIKQENHEIYNIHDYLYAPYEYYTLYQQLLLHSDPAIRIFGFEKPDYIIQANSLYTTPESVNNERDSFEFHFTVANLKRAVNDSFNIVVSHIGPLGQTVSTFKQRVKAPYYDEAFKVKLKIGGLNLLGLNKIYVQVDEQNEIDETNENNNKISLNGNDYYSFYILSSDVKASMPCEFAIVNKKEDVELIATAVNAFSKSASYIFQIDTSQYFNSPLKRETIINASTSNFSWKPNLDYIEGVTYYWRVARKAGDNEQLSWSNSSFSYVPKESKGWRQQHEGQFDKNDFRFLEVNPGNSFNFLNVIQTMNVKSQVYIDELNIPFTILNGAKIGSLTPLRGNIDAMNIVAYTPKGFWKNSTKTLYGSVNTGSTNVFSFDIGTETGRKGVKLALDAAPDSSFVFIYCYFKNSNSDYNYKEWEKDANTLGFTLYNTLKEYGATEFDKFKTGPKTYCYVFRKGYGKIEEKIGTNIFDTQIGTGEVPYKGYFGFMSAKVGPAKKWETVKWDFNFNNPDPKDTFIWNRLYIYKIDKGGNESYHTYRAGNITDLSDLDANLYPYIRLEYDGSNGNTFTPANIQHWTVNYQSFPDLFIDIKNQIADTIDQGQELTIEGFAGLFESQEAIKTNIKISLISESNERIEKTVDIPEIKQGQLLPFKVSFDTKGINGNYQLVASINSDASVIEKITFNNNGVKSIHVKPDRINPIMDVTFDGIKILDGDIVSPKPSILISVKDENKYLLINDKKSFKFSITNLATKQKINLAENEVIYAFPTNTNNNKASITILPKLEDGTYELSVNTSDVSGNFSGNNNYTVTFKVITKKEISNLVNYPNPFSNSTRFIFDVTGEIPQNFKILIMTLSGKVVREITAQEFGSIKIGRNISEFAWNGTDEYGNKLGNGVYLYKMVIANKEIEVNSKFNTEGFGKMMILR